MKIDLHCHTIPNNYLDTHFVYNGSFLKTYVVSNKIELIGITNHNIFDKENFLQVREDLKGTSCIALPGIEISLEEGHILVLGDNDDRTINLLENASNEIQKNDSKNYKMKIEKFNQLFSGKGYLLIPHYDKKPELTSNTISSIKDQIICGEVESPKKFFRLLQSRKLIPLYFSDIRIGLNDKEKFYEEKSRFTYLNCNERTIKSITNALLSNNSVALSPNCLPDIFQILNGKSEASTGINVLLGKRSSGKTYTLDHIANENKNTLYIKQFEISQGCDNSKFNSQINNAELSKVLVYFEPFSALLASIDKLKISDDIVKVKNYIVSLKENARRNVEDQYSKCPLFNYKELEKIDTNACGKILSSLSSLLTAPTDYSLVITKKIKVENLSYLYNFFMEKYKTLFLTNKIIDLTNDIAKSVSDDLSSKSSAVRIQNIKPLEIFKHRYIRFKFNNLLNLWGDKIINYTPIMTKFNKSTKVFRQTNKTQLKKTLGVAASNKIDYLTEMTPFDAYIEALGDENITKCRGNERFKLFFDYEVTIQNITGSEISGGEKAEFLLLNKLLDYQQYDMVVIDEMESSFDNPFLNKEIVNLLHDIAKNVTVFISTHNNNLGVSLHPNYYIYHRKSIGKDTILYERFYGDSSSIELHNDIGNGIKTSDVLINTMEANYEAYEERRKKYENFEN